MPTAPASGSEIQALRCERCGRCTSVCVRGLAGASRGGKFQEVQNRHGSVSLLAMASVSPPSRTTFGRLLRHVRRERGVSQQNLAYDAEVSVRHLSFLETGRAAPSRDVVLALACSLDFDDVGLFLEAAGYLAPYVSLAPDSEQLRSFMETLRDTVERQPLPALVHDRFGTVHHLNERMRRAIRPLLSEPWAKGAASGHHLLAALRPAIVNWEDVASLYRRRLFRELVRGGADMTDEVLEALYHGLDKHQGAAQAAPQLLTRLVIRRGEATLRFDFLTATLGTPQEITLRNYRLVTFMPTDDETRAALAEDAADPSD